HFVTDRGPVYALDDVSIALRAGEVTAIVGESGCGKSMLAMSILGLAGSNASVSGSIVFEGQDLRTLSESRLRRIRGKDIGIAITCGPRLLIADGPTTALDVTIQAGILRLLLELRERFGMTIMLITHDLGVVADIADRVAVMYAGRAVETARVEDLFAQPQHPYTLGLLGAIRHPGSALAPDGRRRLQEIPGTVPTRHAPASNCLFA